MRVRALSCVALASLLLACGSSADSRAEDDVPARAVGAPGPVHPEGHVVSRLVADGVRAFDLRVLADGALLVTARAGEVLATRLDRGGEQVGPAVRVAPTGGEVRSLVAGSSAGRAAVAWIRTEAGTVLVERALGAGRQLSFGPAVELERWSTDDASGAALGARELALRVTSAGEFRLLHRATPIACEGQPACATFRHSDLGHSPPARPGRPALAARDVCPWPLPGIVETGGRTYYGLCAVLAGVPRSMLYLLQPEPQYAQADPALEGCQPLGVLALGDDARDATAPAALFAADCPSGREVVRLDAPGVSPLPVGAVLAPRCEQGQPALRIGARQIPLPVGRDRLEGFVPPSLAPALARVVWTGDTFLVAQLDGTELHLRSVSCSEAAQEVLGPTPSGR